MVATPDTGRYAQRMNARDKKDQAWFWTDEWQAGEREADGEPQVADAPQDTTRAGNGRDVEADDGERPRRRRSRGGRRRRRGGSGRQAVGGGAGGDEPGEA